MACISVVLSPALPKMSTTSPIGFLALSGHSTIRTIALSPVCPPFRLSLGINMSFAKVLFSVTKKANPRVTCNFPTNTLSLDSNTSNTSPSGSAFFFRANNCTFTRSPSMAWAELCSVMNTGVPPPSGMNEFFPLLRRTKVPSAIVPKLFNR